MKEEFKAVIVEEVEPKKFERRIGTKKISDLPEGDTVIRVVFSSLNFKDALSSIGNKGVTRNYPHTPGIDAAGIIISSDDSKFEAGDEVIVTGHDLGMNTSGGFAEYIRVPADWVVKKPENLSMKEAMYYGTAGFTAALSVNKFLKLGVKPKDGEILVTGATGGVGSVAVGILSKLGYSVTAATGKLADTEMLMGIGATSVIDRNEIDDKTGKPLLKARWAGVIDTVGGNTLSTAIRMCKYNGAVTTCGNAAGFKFDANVYPFILKGVSLLGIDSVLCPMDLRVETWNKLASEWKLDGIEKTITEVGLEGVFERINLMLDGKHTGRTIVEI